ncbi:MAG: peptidoglycan-binding protein [Nitrococcus mobilis]|nr:peptidoglycan-binding protein [Nitrococcus mobilis]
MAGKSDPFKFNIRVMRGSQGAEVKEIQQKLNDFALANSIRWPTKTGLLEEDGIFGSNTEKAVRDFQNRKLLLVDGLVGPFTFAMLSQEDFVVGVAFIGIGVPQNDIRKCWAAATEYWLKHQPAFPLSQDEVIEKVREHAALVGVNMDDAVLPSGALTFTGQRVWEKKFLIKGISERAETVTAEFAAKRLRRSGKPLMMGDIEFDTKSMHFTIGHVRVLLGVQCSFLTPGDFTISFSFMDPFFAPHFRSIKLSELHKSSAKTAKREFMTWVDFGIVPT